MRRIPVLPVAFPLLAIPARLFAKGRVVRITIKGSGLNTLFPAVLVAFGCLLSNAVSQTFPERPGQREFIVDKANIIQQSQKEKIRAICQDMAKAEAPLVIVTIPSLSEYEADDIESYARALFDHWGIGRQAHNFGILMLVSPGDRKARIQLGGGWRHEKDETVSLIMHEIMVPEFKKGNYTAGISEGAKALDTMASGMPVSAPQPAWHFWAVILGTGLVIAVGISLITHGQKGWGWALLGFVGALVVGLFLTALSSATSSGGSFGGGSSGGGGGATGSW